MSHELTGLEKKLINYLETCLSSQAGIPSYEELRAALGLSSKDFVSRVLDALEDKGYVRRQRNRSRSLILLRTSDGHPYRVAPTIRVPLVAAVPASFDTATYDGYDPEGYIELTRDLIPADDGVYALHVSGDSMIDALINDGDVVIMHHEKQASNGDLVAVWIRGEESSTLKRYFREGNRIRLQPENRNLSARYFSPADIEVQGKVMMVIRRVEQRLAA